KACASWCTSAAPASSSESFGLGPDNRLAAMIATAMATAIHVIFRSVWERRCGGFGRVEIGPNLHRQPGRTQGLSPVRELASAAERRRHSESVSSDAGKRGGFAIGRAAVDAKHAPSKSRAIRRRAGYPISEVRTILILPTGVAPP